MFRTASKRKDQCTVCGQKITDLMALDCPHQMCPGCIRQSVAQSKTKKIVICSVCQHTTIITEDMLRDKLFRKSYKSSEKKKQDTVLDRKTATSNSRGLISAKDNVESPDSHCNYHFNQKTHVCVTCFRGVCIRCLQTLCQQHKVYNHKRGIQVIKKQLVSIYNGKVEETDLRLKQLNERKRYYFQRYDKTVEQIYANFSHIRQVLSRKQEQLVSYCKTIFTKLQQDYDQIHETIKKRVAVLDKFKLTIISDDCTLESLQKELKTIDSLCDINTQLSCNLKLDKVMDESKMEKILYQIGQLTTQKGPTKQRKYRTTTENAQRNSLKVFRSIPPTKGLVKEH